MISAFFINLLNLFDFICNHPIISGIASIIAIFLVPYFYPLETLFHELGHALATYLSYIKNKNTLQKNFKPNIEIKVSLSKGSLKGDEISRGETNSDYRKWLENQHPLYIKQEIFIARGGVIFGTLFFLVLMTYTIIYFPPNISLLVSIILLIALIFFNINNYFDNKNTPTSDCFKVKKYKEELKQQSNKDI